MKAGVASGGGAALPGMIFNARKWVDFTCADGEEAARARRVAWSAPCRTWSTRLSNASPSR